jgi:hypothetical protein
VKREDNSSNGPLSLAALSGRVFIGVPHLGHASGLAGDRLAKPGDRFLGYDWRLPDSTPRAPPFWKLLGTTP